MRRKIEIRCELYFSAHDTDRPIIEIDDEEESIINVQRIGKTWWVYIERWADDES